MGHGLGESCGPDRSIDHISIVTKLEDGTGYPFVSQHTPARTDRYWSWDPKGDDWIENTDADDDVKPKA